MADTWSLVYEGFDPEEEGLREALCALGNGVFCTRGAGEEARAGDGRYPGTYLAGGYNRLQSEISGEVIENESLVNLPNWLPLSFRRPGGEWFDPARVELQRYRQVLDLRHGILSREIVFRDPQGGTTRLTSRRLVHMARPHLAALELIIEPQDWSGEIEVRTAIEGRVRNQGVARYSDLNGEHLEPLRSAIFACRSEDPGAADGMVLLVRTNQSRLEIAEAVRTRLWRGRRQVGAQRRNIQVPNGYVAQIVPTEVAPDTPLRIEKVLSLHTARDAACASCEAEAGHDLGDAGGFAELLASHSEAWDHLWRRFEISFRDEDAQRGDRIARIIRLHTFHVLQTASLNAAYVGIDAGIPPRGWTGEAYRGHIMWDELFVFPFLTLRLPEVARNLLMYRYRRLPEARRAARAAGFRGAMFPWQSGSNGREESQRLHLNPRSGRWITDHSHLQRHINATIAYNIYHYYQATRDTEFLSFYGAELLFEVARFWSSLARYNEEQDRFEILGVMGPDEYHEGYPGAASSGLNNNAFTNVMAVWVLGRALELLEVLPEDAQEHLRRKLSLDDAEVGRWRRITRRMKIPFLGERGEIISQFEGYEGLEELDWDGYRRKYDNVQRLDRILESEGDTPNRYKVSKQADVLMLFYLLTSDELAEIFGDLGYPFSGETIPKNIDYYLARTSHGSTLSWMVHAWILARGDRERSWKLFNEALRSDVADIQGGTTPEGIHLGAMAGTVDQIQRGYTGIVPRRDTLWFEPCLPQELEELRLRIRYRGYLLEVVIDQERLRVRALRAKEHPITVGHRGETIKLDGRSTCEFSLAGRRVDTRAPR